MLLKGVLSWQCESTPFSGEGDDHIFCGLSGIRRDRKARRKVRRDRIPKLLEQPGSSDPRDGKCCGDFSVTCLTPDTFPRLQEIAGQRSAPACGRRAAEEVYRAPTSVYQGASAVAAWRPAALADVGCRAMALDALRQRGASKIRDGTKTREPQLPPSPWSGGRLRRRAHKAANRAILYGPLVAIHICSISQLRKAAGSVMNARSRHRRVTVSSARHQTG